MIACRCLLLRPQHDGILCESGTGEVKFSGAGVEAVTLNAELLHERHEQVAQRHIGAAGVTRIDMSRVSESATGNKDGQVAVGVRSPVAHSTAEQHNGVVEQTAGCIGFANRIEFPEAS